MTPLPRSPWRSAEHDALAATARRFLEREVVPRAAEFRAQGHPDRALYRRAGELGLLGLSVPVADGGGGGGFAEEAVLLAEQVLSGDSALGLGVHCGIVPHYLLAYGTAEQRRRWLPRLCSGELLGAIAMTEPDAGSDLRRLATRAVPDGEGFRLSGSKTFISNGFLAELVIVAAVVERPGLPAAPSLLVCEVGPDTPGFRRGGPLAKLGLKGQDTAELFFDRMPVPAGALLGAEPGLGLRQLMEQLPRERLLVAVTAVAGMQRALELTTEHVRHRHAFGGPLLDQQSVRFTLAECLATTRAAQAFLDQCIEAQLRGELDPDSAAMAKFWLTEQEGVVIDRCLQLFGGYGYMAEYPIAQLYADARVHRIFAGANEVLKELVARRL